MTFDIAGRLRTSGEHVWQSIIFPDLSLSTHPPCFLHKTVPQLEFKRSTCTSLKSWFPLWRLWHNKGLGYKSIQIQLFAFLPGHQGALLLWRAENKTGPVEGPGEKFKAPRAQNGFRFIRMTGQTKCDNKRSFLGLNKYLILTTFPS